jgi:hypothetical protein
MTMWVIGAVTLIVVVLIIGRRSSPYFKWKSEEPKYEFLASIGVNPETIQQHKDEDAIREPSTVKKEISHESNQS